jgi:alanine-glyoxylate transaminase/serine-glyoxylate transaminase/serine-pyruvate transaminase
MHQSGRHFLQIPGPTNVPDRILRAMAQPTIDHRGPEFAAMGREVLEGLRTVFKTSGPVLIFPASGTGAWEAALVNTLSPGDKVLAFDIGEFAKLWHELARRLGLDVDVVPGDWKGGVDPDVLEAKLADDREHKIRAVLVVHNETSTGVTSRVADIRKAMDRVHHPALLMVDAVSSLGSIDLRHDEWGIDVTITGSQKGLMLPPGLSFNAVSEKAVAASRSARFPKNYWSWEPMLAFNQNGFFPYTPATNLLYGLREALCMLRTEGLENVFERHRRLAEAARTCVKAWGLEILCRCSEEYSNVVTAVVMPEGHDADEFRKLVLQRFNMSLGAGLGRLKGRVFRIGHLGDFNELMLSGTLCGVEMGLTLASVPHTAGGGQAAMAQLCKAMGTAESISDDPASVNNCLSEPQKH